MDMRELRSFFYIARLRSFSRAAAELRIAQPALSRQIRKLEEELGVTLLTRHAKGVELTHAGEIVLKRAEVLIQAVRQIKTEVNESAAVVSGQITVAMPPAVGSIILPTLLRRFRTDYPNVSVHLMEGIGQTLHGWLSAGRVDAAIMHNPPPMRLVRVEPLVHEALYVIGPSGKTRPASYELRDLANLPLVLPGYPHFARLLVEQAAAEQGIELQIAVEVDGAALTCDLVAAGFGYGISTYAAVSRRLGRGDLRAAPFVDRKLYSTVGVGYRDSEAASPALTAFLAELRRVIATVVANGEWPGQVQLAGKRRTTARPDAKRPARRKRAAAGRGSDTETA